VGLNLSKRVSVEDVLRLLKDGKISLGKAAELSGLKYEEMRKLVIRRGLKPFIVEDEDLDVFC